MKLTSEQYKELSKKEFTKAANKYETNNAGVYNLCKKDYPDILKEIEKEDFETLLDAGCGPAPMLTLLSTKYPNKHFTGIDLTEAMINKAKEKNLPNCEFIVGDCENLPFNEDSFDVIICSMSAHHYPNIKNFYKSCFKVLKSNGRLILRDMTTSNKAIAWFGEHIEMPLANKVGHGDVRMLEIPLEKKLMEEEGLKVEIAEQRKDMRLHMVARKPLN